MRFVARRLLLLGAVFAALAMSMTPALAGADDDDDDGGGGGAPVTAPPPLTGTRLEALERVGVPLIGTIEVTSDCDVDPSPISWEASGVATGTYSGPYEETGTATLTNRFGGPFTFTAEFTIDSPLGFVRGTKGYSVPGGTTATCTGPALLSGTGVPYTATITTATGTCTTEGSSSILVSEFPASGESFDEVFDTGTLPVCTPTCPPDDDEDGEGLNDSRESILSTLLGNPDADRDGIRDGNDDANGNGEDDEDEDDDDDDDDGCADEDSDDD